MEEVFVSENEIKKALTAAEVNIKLGSFQDALPYLWDAIEKMGRCDKVFLKNKDYENILEKFLPDAIFSCESKNKTDAVKNINLAKTSIESFFVNPQVQLP